MKLIKLSIIFILITIKISYGQDSSESTTPGHELYFENTSTSQSVYAFIHPVSVVFNGNYKYDFTSINPLRIGTTNIDYICGVNLTNNLKVIEYLIPPADIGNGLNYELSTQPSDDALSIFSMGIYKVIFRYTHGVQYINDTVLIEQDAGDNYDLYIKFVDNLKDYGGEENIPGLAYQIYNIDHWGEVVPCSFTNNYIKMWDPYPYNPNASRREKNYGDYSFDNSTLYSVFPMDCRMHCPRKFPNEPDQNHVFPYYDNSWYEEKQGVIPLNLTIKKNVSTPISFYDYNYNEYSPSITVLQGAKLTLFNGFKLDMQTYSDGIHGTNLIINSSGKLELQNNTQINVYNKNKVFLDCYSYLNCGTNAQINIYNGGDFNWGYVYKSGVLHLNFYQSINRFELKSIDCNNENSISFDDSTHIRLLDGAILDIPENASLIIDGPGASIQLDSGSSINFGYNSKLIVRNGANIKAYYSKFTSTSSTTLWDGVYLEDCSNDTIQYCEFDNAYSGLNIRNKSNSFTVAGSAIVTNCLFKNTSTSQLLNGIYAYNSNLLLIKENTIQSTNLNNGFTCGIFLNGCPSGNINIIGNTINNASTGITSIQTSPLISRNTLNGLTGNGNGIYLDNSNGTIKNNSINYYSTSIIMYYSNPYVLKNNLLNPFDANINLQSNSVPILKPIINGTSEYWYSGNNILTGSPTSGGITFQDDSYPEMDLGYKKNPSLKDII